MLDHTQLKLHGKTDFHECITKCNTNKQKRLTLFREMGTLLF